MLTFVSSILNTILIVFVTDGTMAVKQAFVNEDCWHAEQLCAVVSSCLFASKIFGSYKCEIILGYRLCVCCWWYHLSLTCCFQLGEGGWIVWRSVWLPVTLKDQCVRFFWLLQKHGSATSMMEFVEESLLLRVIITVISFTWHINKNSYSLGADVRSQKKLLCRPNMQQLGVLSYLRGSAQTAHLTDITDAQFSSAAEP